MAAAPTVADRNNNPGNLRDPRTGSFRTFTNADEGYAALMNDLQGKVTGASSTGLNGDSSLYDFASKYAPSSDNNDPAQYAANLANTLGVRPDTKLSELQPRIPDFAQAVARNEGFSAAASFTAAPVASPTITAGPEQPAEPTPLPTDPNEDGFIHRLYQGVFGPVVNMIARPGQLAQHALGDEQPIEGRVLGIDVTDPYKQTPGTALKTSVGQGLGTVGLGLGPVTGGAAIGAGAALEEDKNILPSLEHPLDNAIVQAGVGAGLGFAGDVALKGVGKGIALVGRAMETAPYADKLIQSAAKNWERILAPTTKANKAATQQVAEELAKTGEIFTSRKDFFTTAEQRAEQAGDVIDNIWNAVPAGTMVDVKPVAQALIGQMKELLVPKPGGGVFVPAENQAAFTALDTKGQELLSIANEKGMAEVNALRKWRQAGDKAIQQAKPFQFAAAEGDRAKIAAAKTASNEARKVLNSNEELAAANKQFHTWNTAKDVMDATLLRMTGRGTPLTETLNTGFGLLSGASIEHAISSALLFKYATRLFQSTLFQSTAASIKSRLARAIESADDAELLDALKYAIAHGGKGLQFIGDFIAGLPTAAKELPKADIPGTQSKDVTSRATNKKKE